MFEWNPDPTLRGEVLKERVPEQEGEPQRDVPDRAAAKTGGKWLVIGFCVSSALAPIVASASGDTGTYTAHESYAEIDDDAYLSIANQALRDIESNPELLVSGDALAERLSKLV